jgi:hypothetical protein
MALCPDDFTEDAFRLSQVTRCRQGDVVRLDGELFQVLATVGFAMAAVSLSTGMRRSISLAVSGRLEKRVGWPLQVEG